ncbi:MAG: 1-acyl-sn-glycerol-3-phosphate acyltransferase [Eubacteriaceae bacterium]|nr:1-acyl-sn-glycerol-3-phosphate acyltransferase [Eubacteriaceae bacterium]
MIYRIVRLLANLIFFLLYRIDVKGKENIPEGVALIISSNHIHWLDPVIIAAKCTRRKVSFMAKHELFENKPLAWLLDHLTAFPVKRGEADVTAIKSALRILKNNQVLGIFPEGTRLKEGEEKKPEPGIAMLAIKSKCGVIPVGIKGNYKFRSTIHLNIGVPVNLEKYYGVKNDKDKLLEASQEIMDRITELSKNI